MAHDECDKENCHFSIMKSKGPLDYRYVINENRTQTVYFRSAHKKDEFYKVVLNPCHEHFAFPSGSILLILPVLLGYDELADLGVTEMTPSIGETLNTKQEEISKNEDFYGSWRLP